MKAYFIRRLLLVPLTLLGVTLIVYSLTRVMPGSPLEQAMMKAQQQNEEGGGKSNAPQGAPDDSEAEKMEEKFDYDKSIFRGYCNWLGVTPREIEIEKKELSREILPVKTNKNGVVTIRRRGNLIVSAVDAKNKDLLKDPQWGFKVLPVGSKVKEGEKETVLTGPRVEVSEPGGDKPVIGRFKGAKSVESYQDKTVEARVVIYGTGKVIVAKVDAQDPAKILSTYYEGDSSKKPEDDGWNVVVQSPDERRLASAQRKKQDVSEIKADYEYRVKVFKYKFKGLLQGEFGESSKYGDDVMGMMLERMPIAIYFGVLSTIIIYSICIPLGILKAIRHRTLVDNASSVIIFIGYSIPGFAFGSILLVYLGAQKGWFPLSGLISQEADTFTTWEKLVDLIHHTWLPLAAYVVSGFAMMTMMMKNNLMDNLSADYVRTAVAKGVSYKSAIFKHAFRNSFIPIATGLGGLITIFVSGSLLIERVFDIQGFGMLLFNGMNDRDPSVIMGVMTVSAFLMMIGHILSDAIVAMVDPRIKFSK